MKINLYSCIDFQVLELLGRENVKINSEQMKDIINLVVQEDELKKKKEAEEKEKKSLN